MNINIEEVKLKYDLYLKNIKEDEEILTFDSFYLDEYEKEYNRYYEINN